MSGVLKVGFFPNAAPFFLTYPTYPLPSLGGRWHGVAVTDEGKE